MEQFGPETYGERVADVYDEWYKPVDTAAEVALLTELAAGGRALELGIGTGRVALPLAASGVEVHGIDASPAMVDQMRAKPGGDAIPVDDRRHGRGARSTVSSRSCSSCSTRSSSSTRRRRSCVASPTSPRTCNPAVASSSHAFVPDTSRVEAGEHLAVKEASLDRVRLDASVFDALEQRLDTTQVRITEQGIRLVHAKLRFAWPPELDLMAQLAGLDARTPLGDVRQAALHRRERLPRLRLSRMI